MFYCKLYKAAGRALGSNINTIHWLKECDFKTYEKHYNACVVPVLDYCSSVWSFKLYQKIDNVQNRAMRCFLGVHRFTPILAMVGDTGWLPSVYRRWLAMLRLWNRLTSMDVNKLTKQVFLINVAKCNTNWSKGVRTVMGHIGLIDHFTDRAGCLADAVLTHSPLTAATRVRYPACEMVMWSDRWVTSVHSGFLPHQDHTNANIGANEHD